MIVQSLYARNFMKYEELSVRHFPEQGVVGIVGDNESGKTTILEAITFALFGRTIKVDESNYLRLICWKDSEMEVRLSFQVEDQNLRVWRRYDRQGGKEAVLYRVEDETEEVLCEGLAQVNTRIQSLFPIHFDVCRQSFYLGQKELHDLYDRRMPNSNELMDKMTGLDRLKSAYESVRSKLPIAQEEVISLEKKISIAEVKICGIDERLDEKRSIQEDLQRQRERLIEIRNERQGQQKKFQIQEKLRQLLNKQINGFEELRKCFLGNELKGRLATTAKKFLEYWDGLSSSIQNLDSEISKLATELEDREKCFEVSNEIFRDLKAVSILVRERTGQIDRNSVSKMGGNNIKNYFLPETIKDRETLLEHRIQQSQKEGRSAGNAFNLSLILACVVIGVLVIPELSGAYPWVDMFRSQPALFQAGALLFMAPTLLVLLGFMVSRHRSLMDSRGRAEKHQMSLNVVKRDLQEESDERLKLHEIPTDSIESFEQLLKLKQNMRYETLRQSMSEIIEKYKGSEEKFSVGLAEISEFRSKVEADVNRLKDKKLKLDYLNYLRLHHEGLKNEISQWSFVGEALVSEGTEDFSEEFLKLGTEISKLKELLRGDYSHDLATYEKLHSSYGSICTDILEQLESPDLAPDIWDEKRLVWGWEFSQMDDLNLDAFLEKSRVFLDQEEYLIKLRGAWFDKFQATREGLLQEDFKVQNSEQRILFMEEAISRIDQLLPKKSSFEKEFEEAKSDLKDKKRELRRFTLLTDLLKGTIESLQARLTPNLSRFIGSILPDITDQRYSRVRVSPELEVEVYSPEKEGYVDCTALSGGTADQLLMCLRLAFASSLIQSTFHAGYSQFLFLDEPLYAFDSKRAVGFLEKILKFNPNFRQVFLITHNRNLFSHFDQTIEAVVDSHTLAL
jgi:DNA repair exonuclease SbcCD ATPase subunit